MGIPDDLKISCQWSIVNDTRIPGLQMFWVPKMENSLGPPCCTCFEDKHHLPCLQDASDEIRESSLVCAIVFFVKVTKFDRSLHWQQTNNEFQIVHTVEDPKQKKNQ